MTDQEDKSDQIERFAKLLLCRKYIVHFAVIVVNLLLCLASK